MSKTSIQEALRADCGEAVILPGQPGYDGARTGYLGGYDRNPLAIVRPRDRFTAADAETIVGRIAGSDAPMRVAQIRVLGGAMARVPSDATAYAHRDAPIMAGAAAFYTSPEDRILRDRWAAEFAAALHPRPKAAYVNFMGNEGETRIRDAYPGAIWERLAAAKRRYDPDNLFRLNQNIPPAGGEGVRQAAE